MCCIEQKASLARSTGDPRVFPRDYIGMMESKMETIVIVCVYIYIYWLYSSTLDELSEVSKLLKPGFYKWLYGTTIGVIEGIRS